MIKERTFQIIIEIIWIIISALIFLGGLLYTQASIISIVLVILIFLWRLLSWSKRKDKIIKDIDVEVLDDFQKVERRWAESGGQTDRSKILWEIAKSRQRGINFPVEGERRVEVPAISNTTGGGQELPISAGTVVTEDRTEVRRHKQQRKRSIFRRRGRG